MKRKITVLFVTALTAISIAAVLLILSGCNPGGAAEKNEESAEVAVSETVNESAVDSSAGEVTEESSSEQTEESDSDGTEPENVEETGKIIPETDPSKGEYFAYAILKEIDAAGSMIVVEQLINEPNEKEITPEVKLAADCRVVKIVLVRPQEKETVTEISIEDISIGSEIGIIFNSDDTARAVIYQEIVEE